jgi:LSD1 subclass zinc finger protein
VTAAGGSRAWTHPLQLLRLCVHTPMHACSARLQTLSLPHRAARSQQRALLALRAHNSGAAGAAAGPQPGADGLQRLPRAAGVPARRAERAVLAVPHGHAGEGARAVNHSACSTHYIVSSSHHSLLPPANIRHPPHPPPTNRPQVPVYGHVLCGGCSIMLMYPLGAQSVKCSVCHHVTGVSQHAPWQGLGGGGGAGGSGGAGGGQQRPGAAGGRATGKPASQTVVVENPPTVDEQGNEVPQIAVGVKEDERR